MAAVATRYNAIKDQINTLSFQFKKNNIPFNAHQIIDVKIFTSHDEALANVNSIQTIDAASIANPSTGLYQYAVNALSNPGTYFDVISLIPETGLGIQRYINSFYVQEYSSELPTIEGKCTIYGFMLNPDGSPVKGATISIEPVNQGNVNDVNAIITNKIIKTKTNDSGAWSLSVFNTSSSGSKYRISFIGRDIDYSRVIDVPALDSVEWDNLISSIE